MAYLFVPFTMTLNDPEGHSRNAGLIKWNSTNFCAIFSTVLTDTALRAEFYFNPLCDTLVAQNVLLSPGDSNKGGMSPLPGGR